MTKTDTPSSDAALAMGRHILDSQSFSRLLGAELEAFSPEETILALDLRDELMQQHGFAHGGVLSYLADNALTYAGGAVLGDVITAEFKINYLRPAVGTRLRARARAIHAGKRQAVCECRVSAVQEDGSEKLVAVAQGTISKR